MKYHAKLFYGANGVSYWSQWPKEQLIEELIIPFINGQVILHKTTPGSKAVLNLKNVFELRVYKTETNEVNGREVNTSVMKESEFDKFDCTEELIKEIKVDFSANNTQSLLQKAFAKPENQVFVIMKFGDEILDSAYEGVVKPLFEKYKLKVIRVDEIQDAGKISDQILNEIAKSKFIYSDLSGERPNCYYETGFSHALGKEIILSINKNDKVHFDLAGHRFIEWATESELRKKLKARLDNLTA